VGCVGGVGVWGVWGVVVWGHSLRSTFPRLHLLRLWTPTIYMAVDVCIHFVSFVLANVYKIANYYLQNDMKMIYDIYIISLF
jgi:hypothetical protein